MSTYLITLTPMGSYYFGGERSFSVGEKDKSELASYIVESNLFPQQTSLLGMLRFWILRNSDAFDLTANKICDKIKAQKLIGEKGFCVSNEVLESSFGKIKKIDFCFLQKKQEGDSYVDVLPAPLDYKLSVDFSNTLSALYNGKNKALPFITYLDKQDEKGEPVPYSSKEGLVRKYIRCDGKKPFEEKDIFIKDQRIGIKRDIKTGLTDDNALYKQIFYRLAEGFRFAFVADMDLSEDEIQKMNNQIVELGGDSSKFILECKAIPENQTQFYSDDLLNAPDHYFKLVLLSDTKLDNAIVEQYSIFSITEHIPFRFLSFNTDEKTNYAHGSGNRNRNKEENRYSLFKRGSVFYFDNESDFKQFKIKIDENKAFQQIGYNKYESKNK